MAVPTIPEFFKGKHIFITGATGFMGKVLVEKLLRSCNDLDTLYILTRGKRGKTATERWNTITELPCFSKLREEYPTALHQKVKIIEGDVREPNLGISEENYNTILEKVTIIFHVAASVRFNDPLPEAIKMNTCGTKHVIELAAKMTNLLVFMHVSTAYCYCHWTREVEEKVYECNIDWKTAVEIAENADPVSFDVLSKKFTEFSPNTYVYSKALAEQIANDYKNQVPVVLFRPSIVISSWKEPIPGWIDNYNGPIGLIIAGGKGVVRVSLSEPDAVPDYMAVDIAIKAMIIAAWKRGVAERSSLGAIDVYNSSTTSSKSVSNRVLVDMCKTVHKECPLEGLLWSPSYDVTRSPTMYRIRAFFVHYLFALVVDSFLRILQQPPMLMRIHIKVHNAMTALGYFTTKEWTFKNTKFRTLNDEILPEDKDAFEFGFDDLDPLEYFIQAARGGKQFLLNENLANIPAVKEKARRLDLADKIIKWAVKLLLGYCLLSYLVKSFWWKLG